MLGTLGTPQAVDTLTALIALVSDPVAAKQRLADLKKVADAAEKDLDAAALAAKKAEAERIKTEAAVEKLAVLKEEVAKSQAQLEQVRAELVAKQDKLSKVEADLDAESKSFSDEKLRQEKAKRDLDALIAKRHAETKEAYEAAKELEAKFKAKIEGFNALVK